jgi:hypothetical protein
MTKFALAGGSVLEALAAELAQRNGMMAPFGAGQKDVSSTPSIPYLHGPNGLWSYPGLERPVISTRVKPRGLAGLLPARPNNAMNPLYPYLTGFTDPAETQPVGVCDDPPTAGQMKNCFQTAVFGRVSYQTRVMEITRLGQVINRGEFTDLMLMNDPLGNAGGNPTGLTIPGQSPGALSLVNEASARFAEVGVKFQNKLMRMLWDGNPANNTAGGGYKEFPGLDRLIGTGKVDAVTGTTCPSLDSLVVNMNYKKVSDNTGNNTVINVLTYTYRMLRNLASRTGLDPVQWVFVMRETLFYELTAAWPCTYLTYRCMFPGQTATGASNDLVVDASDAIAMRDGMRAGNYLVIDGIRVPVVLDDALDEETSGDTSSIDPTCFASDIKILPLSVQGNKSVLFWEYFAWNGPNAALNPAVASFMPMVNNFFWSDGGQYIWHMKPPTMWCVQWAGLIEPRIILLTPHLAANIQNVQYCPLMHPRDAFPDDPYFVNGGATSRDTSPSWYRSWSQ